MTKCQRCAAKSPNAFLCVRCERTIAGVLADLPWWLNRLVETATGQTRMADTGGRRSARRKDLDGETPLAACIERFPDDTEDDLNKARKARQDAALAHALATGGCNHRASQLLSTVADSLAYWVRVLCESRGARYRPAKSDISALGANHAAWLAVNISAIASSQEAGDITVDIEGHLDDIVEIVNRKQRTQFLGPCPGYVDDQPCGRSLRAPSESAEVHCRGCKSTHTVSLLLLARREEFERTPVTWKELVNYNAEMPPEFRVPLRTMQHWRRSGTLKPREWLHPDGQRGIERHSERDKPLYLWSDVRELLLAKPQRKATGAAARRADVLA